MSHAAAINLNLTGYANSTFSRNELIETCIPLVKRIVYRIASHLPSHVDIEDLFHAGVVGLIQAVEKFDPKRDNQLSTYAAFRIRGAVLSELRSRDILSRSSRKKVRTYYRTAEQLEQRLGHEPNEEEVAREMGINQNQLNDIRQIAGISIISLEEMGFGSGTDIESGLDVIRDVSESDPLTQTRRQELKTCLAHAVSELSQKEQMVLSLYYEEELTLKEIGQVLDLTESRISQIHSRILLALRKKMKKQGILDED